MVFDAFCLRIDVSLNDMSDQRNALDIENHAALREYLRATSRIGAEEEPRFSNLAGGVSNRTVLVERQTGESWVVKQALEKLRVAADWFSSPQRIHREALGLRWLAELAPEGAITPLVFEDHAHHLLAMQAVPQPHENWKTLLLRGEIEAEHIAQFARLLAEIHARAFERRAELAPIFSNRSFFESLRLEPYYGYSAAQVPAAAPFLRALILETRRRALTLTHGDYSPKNILVRNGRLILLDHEVIHWGDPAFDLGFALAHFLSKAHHLVSHRAKFVEAAQSFWREYSRCAGSGMWRKDLEIHAAHHALGCLLARVAGRSPLEYLAQCERENQRRAVVDLMHDAPTSVANLTERFIEKLEYNEPDAI
jgi:aminoglycoside phosphotransferase (APT) family kinase protein